MGKNSRQQTVDSSQQSAISYQQSVIGNQQSGKTVIKVSSLPTPCTTRVQGKPYSLFGRPTLHHKGAGQSAEQNPVPDWYRAGSPLPPTPYPLPPNKGGFALISMIIILSLLGIAAGVATSFAHRLKTSRRQVATEDELKALKEAILGNPREYSKEGRSNFGYLGDMGLSGTGQLPALADLYTKGTQPTYGLDATTGQGRGWAGPYITPILREDLPDLLKDPYGNTYSYPTTPDHPTVPYNRASDNEVVSAIIRSIGPNKTDDNGTGDDRQIEILQKETRSTVSGYVLDSTGAAISGATVTLYYPVAGSVSNLSTTTNASGLYSFSNIPFGIRTISVAAPSTGTLKYADGSALCDAGNTDALSFNITNSGATAVTVNAIKLDYTITGNAYFEQVWVGINGVSTQVFDYSNDALNDALSDTTNPRGPTGTTITFADTSIPGGSSASTTKRILVAADSVTPPSIILSAKGGGTLNIRYLNFRKNQTSPSGNPAVSVENESFIVTLYNLCPQCTNPTSCRIVTGSASCGTTCTGGCIACTPQYSCVIKVLTQSFTALKQ